MEKNLLFDVLAALQMGGYSDDVVLYNFVSTDEKSEFGEEWSCPYKCRLSLNGRCIAICCEDMVEVNQLWDFLEREARFYRFANTDDMLFNTFSKKVIILIYC